MFPWTCLLGHVYLEGTPFRAVQFLLSVRRSIRRFSSAHESQFCFLFSTTGSSKRNKVLVPTFSTRHFVEEWTMGFFSKDINTMDDLLLHGLQDIYYAEQQITKALPKMIDKATNRDLAQGLKNHLEETNKQIERLDQVFKKLGKRPSGTDCPAIDGLIKEADETAGDVDDKSVLDAAIIANAQAVEHYEIARYGSLIAWAEELGHDDIVRFLTTNLNEEKAANTKLNSVALRKGVNRKAAS